jgi:hypothetical protein
LQCATSFHIRDDQGLVADEEGSELPDLAAAKAEARHSAQDFIIDTPKCGERLSGRWIEIADGHGTVLDCLFIRDVMH